MLKISLHYTVIEETQLQRPLWLFPPFRLFCLCQQEWELWVVKYKQYFMILLGVILYISKVQLD